MQKQKENHWSESDIATVCGIKVSSLRKWMQEKGRAENEREKKRGRPEVITAEVRWKLRKCYQDHYGQWGPKVLQCWAKRQRLGSYASDTIARVIADLKPLPEKKPTPVRYEIDAPMVMWSEDGTGFKDGNRKREAMILQDECARFKVHTRLADGPAKEEDVLIYLEEAFQKYGAPLILKHDNIAYQNTARVEALCEKWGVLLLNSPLRYPMYNGKKERSMRDIKSYVRALHKNKVSSCLDTKLKLAVHDLNEERPRAATGLNHQ